MAEKKPLCFYSPGIKELQPGDTLPVGSSGTVTSVSVTTANGVSGSVATATTTPAITLALGAITPSSVNGITHTANADGFEEAGGTTSRKLTVSGGDVALVGGASTVNINWYKTTSDKTITGTALAVMDAFPTMALFANSVYWFDICMMVTTNLASTGFGAGLKYTGTTKSPTGSWRTMHPLGRNVADDLPFYGNDWAGENVVSTTLAVLTGDKTYPVYIRGSIVTSTSGNLEVWFKSEVATTGTVTIFAGSYAMLTKTV